MDPSGCGWTLNLTSADGTVRLVIEVSATVAQLSIAQTQATSCAPRATPGATDAVQCNVMQGKIRQSATLAKKLLHLRYEAAPFQTSASADRRDLLADAS
jgi:hypothetical protein